MKVILKDGSQLEIESGKSCYDVALQISEGLARAAACAKVDGKLVDLDTVLEKDCELEIVTVKSDEGLRVLRHTAAHILAQAVKSIFPTVKLAIGPAIDNGFYYDFDFKTAISKEDFEAIEAEMQRIAKANFPIKRLVLSKKDAIKLMQSAGEDYKVELINGLAQGEEISLYQQGDFIDLCAGPHLRSTGMVKCFKLTSLAGAYWRGNENNKMLSRIYGTAFEKKSELKEHLQLMEEAKKRDHNKLGRELNYFMTSDVVGQGLPLFMPKGAKILQILERWIEDEEEKRGYLLTRTPFMAKSDLYKISGHWDHYRDGMFVMGEEGKDDEVFALRPMTCPFQYEIYKQGLKSYRDLPVRYAETSTLFRNEASGEMHGLIRLRQFTLADGHIICTPEQVESEFRGVMELIYYIQKSLGITDEVKYRFSRWDPKNKAKYIDDPVLWEKTEEFMKQILDNLAIDYVEARDEAAFYGPKLDIQFKNVYGKEDTVITVQIDFALAERFDMSYIDEKGEKQRPFIIHRSSIGCYERTLALLIEKYAGALPLWIAPVQVKVLSLTDRTAQKANEIVNALRLNGFRAEADNRSETIGYKIRSGQLEKTPYMLIIGDKEASENVVSVRGRKEGDLGVMQLDSFMAKIKEENDSKSV